MGYWNKSFLDTLHGDAYAERELLYKETVDKDIMQLVQEIKVLMKLLEDINKFEDKLIDDGQIRDGNIGLLIGKARKDVLHEIGKIIADHKELTKDLKRQEKFLENTKIPELSEIRGKTFNSKECEYFKKNRIGWKIHLFIRKSNIPKVYVWLFNKGECFKISATGEKGKNITIYIGSMDKALNLAKELHMDIDHYLEYPQGGSTTGNVLLFPKVSARFDYKDNESGLDGFNQYGIYGVPLLNMHYVSFCKSGKYRTSEGKLKANAEDTLKEWLEEDYAKLKQKEGNYFIGSKKTFEDYLDKLLKQNWDLKYDDIVHRARKIFYRYPMNKLIHF